ncbi:MAG: M55 family metallopeptidase [Alphaproteobacteria bacterium]|nr:M55 family metallopeptidase [Alphaproteobacteria bacterium]
MRFYISVDIEGIVGVVSRDHTGVEGFEYQAARIWMTDTAAAAAQAALDSGAHEVVLSDSHGSMQNLILERLPPGVQLVRSKPRPLGMLQGIDEGRFDGAMFVGWHTGATHNSGILGHTMRSLVLRELRLNGRSVSEAGFYAPLAGQFGVPVIMISGDDQFVAETRSFLPDVEAATVKWAYGHTSARTLMPAAAHALVADAAKRAIARLKGFKPTRLEKPVLEVAFKHRLPAEFWALTKWVERLDAYTIRYQADDMADASRFMVFLLGYAPTVS